MVSLLDDYLERQLARGKAYFTREEARRRSTALRARRRWRSR
jgi:hypothetical protein